MNKTMWPATLTVLPNRLNCICKQIETHWNYSWNIWLWKGLDKRTAGVNSSKHFPQTRLGKHYSRQKSSDTADKKKTLAIFKTGGRNFKACLSFGWESGCPDNLCAWSSISKTGEQKKIQKHDGSSLETKIDTVLNAAERVQAQIDSPK